MGRPIQKKWFGPAGSVGYQIVVNGVKWQDGTTSSDAYIVKQTGSAAYVVSDGLKTEIVFMVNASSTGDLLPGQCYILATPFGGTALPCKKIAQFRVDLFAADGTVDSYSWSTIPAAAAGQADLITAASGAGVILSVAVGNAGAGYFVAPTVGFTGGGSGATATATLTNGTVSSIAVDTGGTGYTAGTVTVSAPPASVTATATAATDGDAVTSGTVTNAGANGYYTSAPIVTVTGPGTGATATATLTAGRVTAIVIDTPGTGYTTAGLTIAAPPAAVQATATATVSV